MSQNLTKNQIISNVETYTSFTVCVAVVKKFSDTLDEVTRKDSKLIEDKFRDYCKGTKGKDNRFVSNT